MSSRDLVQRALGNGTRILCLLAVVSFGPYVLRLLAAYPVASASSGFGERPLSARFIHVLALAWTVGGLFALGCVVLSVAGLLVYVVRRRSMPTAFGRPGVAAATLAITGLSVVSYEARPEIVAASWPTGAMEPLLSSIRTICENEGACPAGLERKAIAPGIRTLAGRGWVYRACGEKEFAVFFSQCWSSDCTLFRWTTGRCCGAHMPSTVALDGGWSALRGDEDEAWIDRSCASAAN